MYLLWFGAGSYQTIIIDFLSDTTVAAAGYREQFVGSLVSATMLTGAIGLPLDQHVQSALDGSSFFFDNLYPAVGVA